jgi:hypothetical protein
MTPSVNYAEPGNHEMLHMYCEHKLVKMAISPAPDAPSSTSIILLSADARVFMHVVLNQVELGLVIEALQKCRQPAAIALDKYAQERGKTL